MLNSYCIPDNTLSYEDEKGEKDTFCSLGVLVGGHTSKQCETIEKGSECPGSYHAVPSTASPLAPRADRRESELHSNVHQAPSADLSLVIPSLLLCAAPMFDPLAVSQLCSFLSNLVFLHKRPLCWNVLPLHQPQLLST